MDDKKIQVADEEKLKIFRDFLEVTYKMYYRTRKDNVFNIDGEGEKAGDAEVE